MTDETFGIPPLPGVKIAGMLLVSFQVAQAAQPGFNPWYNREHIPARIGLGADGGGFQATTRYLAQGATPRYVNMYEVGDAAFLASEEYLAVREAEAQMDIVKEQTAHMRATAPDLYDRRIMKTYSREALPASEVGRGPLVLESLKVSDPASRKSLFTWVIPAFFGVTGRDPQVAFSTVGLVEGAAEVLFFTGYRNGAKADWTQLEGGIATPLLSRVEPDQSAITTLVCLPLAYFGPNR